MESASTEVASSGGNGSAEPPDDANEGTVVEETEPCLTEITTGAPKQVIRSQSILQRARTRAQDRWRTLQQHVEEQGQVKRETTIKWQNLAKMSRNMSQGVAEFFGVNDEPQAEREKRIERWRARSRMMHSNSMFFGGHKIDKDQSDDLSYGLPDNVFEMAPVTRGYDDVDAAKQSYRVAQPMDPLARGRRPVTSRIDSRISASSNAQRAARSQSLRRKDSVVRMAYDGLRVLAVGTPDKPTVNTPMKSRSFSPALKSRTPMVVSSIDSMVLDETFFDVAQPTSARVRPPPTSKASYLGSRGLASIAESTSIEDDAFMSTVPPTPNYIRNPPLEPSTPGVDEADGIITSMARRELGLADILLEQNKHQIGIGFVGKVFNRQYRQSRIDRMPSIIDDFDFHRPFFTYWVTFVQLTCFLFMVMVYGTAKIGFTETSVSGQVQLPTLTWETVQYNESDNMWIGPRQSHLVHLGAKYSPCMRKDVNVMSYILKDREAENKTACCIQNDGAGCRQSSRNSCSLTIARWIKYDSNNADITKRAGSVCGYDSRFCLNNESQYAPHDITQWPVCITDGKNHSGVEHMACEITARPCCVGILGQCLLTTAEHCKFLQGYFHSDAQLCSQVSCLSEVCGMLPFYKDSPNQFYRLWTSLFIHAGLIPLIITVFFQMFVMRDVEKLAGWLRVGIIYLLSGIAGNLSSAIFLPYHPEAGTNRIPVWHPGLPFC